MRVAFNYSTKCFLTEALLPSAGRNATRTFASPLCDLSTLKQLTISVDHQLTTRALETREQ